MSLEQEARAAAVAEYPDTDVVTLVDDDGETLGAMMVSGSVMHAMARTPYAQGYQAGYAAALSAVLTQEELDVALAGWNGEWVESDREAMGSALAAVLALRLRR